MSDGSRVLEVVALSAGGRGVARSDGQVWFLPRTFPGDLVRAERRGGGKRWIEGQVVERIADSALRRFPECPLAGSCGGCPWMALQDSAQQYWKWKIIHEALVRVGRFADPPVAPMLAGAQRVGYRNRAEFTFDGTGTAPRIGFMGGESGNELVEIDRCCIQSEEANELLATIRAFFADPRRHDTVAEPGSPRRWRLILRVANATGERLVALREETAPFPHATDLAAALMASSPAVVGVVRLVGRPGRRGGVRALPLLGRDWIAERFVGFDFRLPAASFLQVHSGMTDALIQVVSQASGGAGGRRILDLYGGVGLYSLAAARAGARAVVVDADRDAVREGAAAARAHGLGQAVSYQHAEVGRFLRARPESLANADLVLANPPRTGLGREVAEALARSTGGQIVVISCDPPTMARDARWLVDGGLRLASVQPIDLFPQTAHVELVATFLRAPAR